MKLPSGWSDVSLGDVVEVLDRHRIPVNSDERLKRQGNVPYYGATGQVGWIDDHLFDEELILLGEDGAPFLESTRPKAYMIRGKSWVNNHAHVLRAMGGVINAFLMHQLNVLDYRPFVSGTTRLKLPQAPMVTMPIRFAPLPEQHRIVAEIEKQLTRLDAAVAALERARANLKRYRASVFKAAVEGRLVPTEAELARSEARDFESAEDLLRASNIHPVQDSRPRPEGWAWVPWGAVGKSQNGRAFPSSQYSSSGVKLLRPGNLDVTGVVSWVESNTRWMPEEWEGRHPDYVVGPGELIMNLTAQSLKDEFLGRVCITGENERCLLNQRLARLTSALILPRYLLWMFKSKVFRWFVNSLNTGSLIQHMFTSQLEEFVLPLPPRAEQERIVAEVERRLSVVEVLETTIDHGLSRAERLRQALLKRAFEGRLVPQDPNDEPASVLLERIRAERTRTQPLRRGRKATAVQIPLREAVSP